MLLAILLLEQKSLLAHSCCLINTNTNNFTASPTTFRISHSYLVARSFHGPVLFHVLTESSKLCVNLNETLTVKSHDFSSVHVITAHFGRGSLLQQHFPLVTVLF